VRHVTALVRATSAPLPRYFREDEVKAIVSACELRHPQEAEAQRQGAETQPETG